MKTLLMTMTLGTLLSFSPAASFAGDCSCSAQCQKDCADGQGKDCKCKNCDCAKSGKCSHGKCDTDKKTKK